MSLLIQRIFPFIITESVETVGGRFRHLVGAATLMTTNKTVEELQKYLFNLVQTELKKLKIEVPHSMTSSTLSNTTWALALVHPESQDKQISISQYLAMMEHIPTEEELEAVNIFVHSAWQNCSGS